MLHRGSGVGEVREQRSTGSTGSTGSTAPRRSGVIYEYMNHSSVVTAVLHCIITGAPVEDGSFIHYHPSHFVWETVWPVMFCLSALCVVQRSVQRLNNVTAQLQRATACLEQTTSVCLGFCLILNGLLDVR